MESLLASWNKGYENIAEHQFSELECDNVEKSMEDFDW